METVVIITEERDGLPVEAFEVTMDKDGRGFVKFCRILPIGATDGAIVAIPFEMILN